MNAYKPSDFQLTSDYIIDNLVPNYATQFSAMNPVIGNLANKISEHYQFKKLIDNIQYKSVLSFVSILVTELIQRDYPLINSAFDTTLLSLRSNILQLTTIANRSNDPDFYQKFPIEGFGDPSQQFNLDLVSLFLSALVKGLANTVDPTWVTPWFGPGPLTPIGIVAKILDGNASSGGDQSAVADNQNQINNAIATDLTCDDD